MRTQSRRAVLLVLGVTVLASTSSAWGESGKPLIEWRFDSNAKWNGWSPGGAIRDVQFDPEGVSFQATGSDPVIAGPQMEPLPATNRQCVIIDLDCSAAGHGELFYTNKTTGLYGGFEPKWMTEVFVPAAGRQSVVVWPFWAGLQKIIRLRFDPPSGARCRLSAVRVVDLSEFAAPPAWTFDKPDSSWRPMHGAVLEHTDAGLVARAAAPQAVIVTTVSPFDAARRSILRLDARCSGEHVLSFYWAAEEEPGLFGQPISLERHDDGRPIELDLRCFPQWKGTITHLAVAFGTLGREKLTIRSLSIDENNPNRPFIRLRHLGFERPINRPGKPAALGMILEHGGGPVAPAGRATLAVDDHLRCEQPTLNVPPIEPGKRVRLNVTVVPQAAGPAVIALQTNGQSFTRTLRIDEAIADKDLLRRRPDDYDVPPPRPVKTRYQIGIYYFPGWSPDQLSRWEKQADFPERDPVLGWYKEGMPEVADWHIKWAVENGLSFFIYDWYWRNGKEDLTQGLNEGFLRARYREHLKFAVMWANHPPFAGHTPEQLLTVTDYWLKNYFRQPNYLTVESKPYVSFFSVHQVLTELGGPEKTRAAFAAMRQRVRDAGLPGLHIAACTGSDSGALDLLRRAGFDSVTAYNYARAGATMSQSPYRHFILSHEGIWKAMRQAGSPPYVPLLTVNWDARPWHGPRTHQRFARRTKDFAEALGRLKTFLDMNGERMAILEAWNEWGEGSYLEPNAEFGFADLEAIRRTFAEPDNWPSNIGPDDVGLGGKYDLRADTK